MLSLLIHYDFRVKRYRVMLVTMHQTVMNSITTVAKLHETVTTCIKNYQICYETAQLGDLQAPYSRGKFSLTSFPCSLAGLLVCTKQQVFLADVDVLQRCKASMLKPSCRGGI